MTPTDTPTRPDSMTPQAQNKAIADACGWAYDPQEEYPWMDADGEGYRHPPDYLTDLNAMHEAESALTTTQHAVFRNILYSDIESDHDAGEGENDERYFVSATAAQRAVAFLKTLGQWEASA